MFDNDAKWKKKSKYSNWKNTDVAVIIAENCVEFWGRSYYNAPQEKKTTNILR